MLMDSVILEPEELGAGEANVGAVTVKPRVLRSRSPELAGQAPELAGQAKASHSQAVRTLHRRREVHSVRNLVASSLAAASSDPSAAVEKWLYALLLVGGLGALGQSLVGGARFVAQWETFRALVGHVFGL